MKRKWSVFVLAFVLCVFCASSLFACGDDGDKQPKLTVKLQYEKIEKDGEVTGYTVSDCYVSYSANGTPDIKVVIPEIYDNKPVKSIGNAAFADCVIITDITLPTSITSIGKNAFARCYKLRQLIIPEGVTSIGEYAFASCRSLSEIDFPSGVTSIGDGVLAGCGDLSHITVAEGNERYHSSGECLIETGEKRLISGCKNSVIPTDGSVTVIGISAFSGCPGLKHISIPHGITRIDDSAFRHCAWLSRVVVPNSVTAIGEEAFAWCGNMGEITVPSSVVSVGDYAFEGNYNHTLYCEAESKPNGWSDKLCSFSFPIVWNCKKNDKDAWGNSYLISNDIRYAINNGAATVIRQPEKIGGDITIPTSVMYRGTSYPVKCIGGSAFYDCSEVTSITVPNGIEIDGGAFRNCTGVKSVIMPNDLTKIEREVFNGCSELESITIPRSVTHIGEKAFSGCYNITEITIPISVTVIEDYAFTFCRKMTIYCEAAERPQGWSEHFWNWHDCPVVWNCNSKK